MREAGWNVILSAPGELPTEDELIELLPGCVGYLAGIEHIPAKVLQAASDLKVISRNGTGTDGIDLQTAGKLQIQICRAEGANARGVAELAFALLLSLARSIPFSDHKIKSGKWGRRRGLELENKHLGLVGCGSVGQRLARFALCLGMRVTAYDPFPDQTFAPSEQFRFGTLDELLEQSDVISLHCPPSADGNPLIDEHVLTRLKCGVLIINTARADLIDTVAMRAALDEGHVAGLGLDVFSSEPPSGDDPLAFHECVIATPHIGGFTKESVGRAVRMAVDNLLKNLPNARVA